MSDDYARVTATVQKVTTAAVLLHDGCTEAWVPRSCLHGADDIALDGTIDGEREFQMRQWIAEQKGFI